MSAIVRVRAPVFHIFGGIGAGAKGFKRSQARLGQLLGEYETLGSVDVDPGACRNFEKIVGVKATCLDLFDYEQYLAFHGHEPPNDWRPAMPSDMQAAAQNRAPWVVFLSAPCKGFSGLLSEKKSLSAKYQALNGLTLRGLWLMLEAWKHDPPMFILFENVPRIATRGRALLDQIIQLLQRYGYATAETTHDCGELGNLAQSRKRFLLVARHMEKVPNFLYEPPKRPLRCVGEILEKLPLPGDPRGGPMHRVPELQMKTWMRLAFVEAGKDWRSLNRLRVEDGVLKDYALVPERPYHNGSFGVVRWPNSSDTVTSNGRPAAGRFSVADPRFETPWGSQQFGVIDWDFGTAPALTSERSPGQGRFSVADPRIDGHPRSVQHGVLRMQDTSNCVTGAMFVGGGNHAVADPRVGGEGDRRFNNIYRVVRLGDTSPAVSGGAGPTAGGLAVADPRPSVRADYQQVKYRVTRMSEQSGSVIAASTTGNGAFALADDRPYAFKGGYGVLKMGDTAGTIGGESLPSNGKLAVADPRPTHGQNAHQNKHAVMRWAGQSKSVTGSDRVGSGALSVADPRTGFAPSTHHNVLHVVDPSHHAKTIGGANHPSGGALSIADPRVGMASDRHYKTGGHYGVVPMDGQAYCVSGHARYDGGPWSVADHRLPAATDRLVALIIAEDDTWHRPFTTLELAALQSLVDPEEMFSLDSKSDSQCREWIGNAVPPDAAQAMGSTILRAILGSMNGERFMLSSEPIWVQPVAIALQVARILP